MKHWSITVSDSHKLLNLACLTVCVWAVMYNKINTPYLYTFIFVHTKYEILNVTHYNLAKKDFRNNRPRMKTCNLSTAACIISREWQPIYISPASQNLIRIGVYFPCTSVKWLFHRLTLNCYFTSSVLQIRACSNPYRAQRAHPLHFFCLHTLPLFFFFFLSLLVWVMW